MRSSRRLLAAAAAGLVLTLPVAALAATTIWHVHFKTGHHAKHSAALHVSHHGALTVTLRYSNIVPPSGGTFKVWLIKTGSKTKTLVTYSGAPLHSNGIGCQGAAGTTYCTGRVHVTAATYRIIVDKTSHAAIDATLTITTP
jgi:hypothetical protein